jgi:hypothetical protein
MIAVNTKMPSITMLQTSSFLRVDLMYRSISESGSPVTPYWLSHTLYFSNASLEAISIPLEAGGPDLTQQSFVVLAQV